MSKNNEIVIKLEVNGEGQLIKASHTIDKTAKASNKLRDSQKELGKASGEAAYKLNQGVVGSSSAARSFSKLNQTIGNGPNGLVGAYATLAANIFAVSAAFNALKEATQAKKILEGLEAQGARTGNTLLLAARRAKEFSQYSLSSAEAMRATAQATSSGISTKDFERIIKVATNASKALGREVPDSVNRLVMAITKMEPELVDELGLTIKMTQASEEYARQTGKTASSLTQLEKQQALLNAWVGQGEAKFTALADSVDTNPYDKLAASFKDLTNTTLNAINTIGMVDIVGWLASDSYALSGALLLFVSTIKNQLLPVLAESAAAAKRNSLARIDELRKQKETIVMLKAETLARQGNASAKLRETMVSEKAPKKYLEWVNAVQKGVEVTEAETKAAERSIKISKGLAQNKLDKSTKKEDKDKFKAIISARESDLANMSKYQAEMSHINDQIAAQNIETNQLRKESVATRLYASAQDARALAIEAAENGKYGQSIKQVVASGAKYKLALTAATRASNELAAATSGGSAALTRMQVALIEVRGAAFVAATGLKAIGTTILTILPWLGIASLAWSVLSDIWNELKPDAWKKQEAALEDFQLVLDSTAKKMKELINIEHSNLDISSKSTASLKNRFNTLAELIDAYNTYNEVVNSPESKEQAKEQAKGLEEANSALFRQTTILGSISPALGAATLAWDLYTRKVKESAQIEIGSLADKIFTITPTSSEAEKALASTFANLERLVPKTTRRFVEMQGGWEKFKNSVTRDKKVQEYIFGIGKVADKAAKEILSVESAVSNLNKAQANFINSLKASTPYDQLADAIEGVSVSTAKLRATLSSGTLSDEDAKGFLSQLNDIKTSISGGILSDATKSDITNLQSIENQLISLRVAQGNLNTSTDEYKNLTKEIKSLEETRSRVSTNVAAKVDLEIGKYKEKVELAQLENISLQSSLILAQSRLSVLQRQGILTGKDVKDQIAAQNQIINLQAKQLQTHADFLKFEADRKKLELEAIKRKKEELLALEKIGLEQQNQHRALYQYNAIWALDPNIKKQAQEQLALLTDTEERKKRIADLELDLGVATRQYNLAQAAANTAQAAVTAKLEEQLTAAEAKYEVEKANQKLKSDLAAEETKLLDLAISRQSAERKLNSILSEGRNETISQLQDINRNYEKRRKNMLSNQMLSEANLQNELNKATELNKTDQVKYWKDMLSSLKEQNTEKLLEFDLSYKISLLEATGLETLEKRIKLEQESIKVMTDYANQQDEILNKETELLKLRKETQAASTGNTMSEFANKAIDYEAATKQLKLAQENLAIRKLGIELEYDLLEAQKTLLVEQLKAKEVDIAKTINETADPAIKAKLETILATVNTSYTRLEANSYKLLKANALRLAEMDVSILKERALKAYYDLYNVANSNSASGSLLQGVRDAITVFQSLNKRDTIDYKEVVLRSVSAGDREIISSSDKTNQLLETQNTIIEDGFAKSFDATFKKTETTSNNEPIIKSVSELVKAISLRGGTPNSPRGMRHHPILGGVRMHQGDDYAAPEGSNVNSVLSGRVIHAGKLGSYGNTVIIRTIDKITGNVVDNLYAHLSKVLVERGDLISQSSTLGLVGSDGRSTGPHLHHETKINGSNINPREMVGNRVSTVRGNDGGSEPDYSATGDITVIGIKSRKEEIFKLNAAIEEARLATGINIAGMQVDFEALALTIATTMNSNVEELKKLGPNGELLASIQTGFGSIVAGASQIQKTFGTSFTEYQSSAMEQIKKMYAEGSTEYKKAEAQLLDSSQYTFSQLSSGFATVAGMIGQVASIVASASQAKIAGIDREIAAEEKRDGKSAASIAKLDALEKKKDSMARKQFNTNKKLMMAQAVMSTAAAVTMALASATSPASFILAGIAGAMGAAQLAIIAGTQYESSYTPRTASMPSSLSIGKSSGNSSVDLAKGPNVNAGGEVGYLRGSDGYGSSANNYRTIGSAYGGDLMRGYGHRGFTVGEKGPEVISPETPITVTPTNETSTPSMNATINIQALDSSDVKKVLIDQKGNIIQMLREAANAHGQGFLEDVNVNVYTRPDVSRL